MTIRARLLLLVAVFYLGFFFLRYYNPVTADIGRHITNGKVLLTQPHHARALLSTNFYSYTHQEYGFINHHWLYGVLAYCVFAIGGSSGLTVLNVLLVLGSMGVLAWWCYQKTGLGATLLGLAVATPLVTARTEVRPELVSLLFLSLYLVIFDYFLSKRISFFATTAILLILQIIWQNTHLFFVFGHAVLGASWLYAAIKRDNRQVWQLTVLGLISVSILVINPNGIAGAIQPFLIFRNYGYMVVENQPLLFALKRQLGNVYLYTVLVLVLGIPIAGVGLFSKNYRRLFVSSVLFLSFSVATLQVLRVQLFLGLVTVPLVALAGSYLLPAAHKWYRRYADTTAIYFALSPVILAMAVAVLGSGLFVPFATTTGVGEIPGSNAAIDFIKTERLVGPIFNNYDIGGYLIAGLFPNEQVFVDNRPEAYPVEFFANDYIAPQESDSAWRALEEKYAFNLIVFNRLDFTPWGQQFLITRISDPSWVPIYVDAQVILFLKNSPENTATATRLALPKELFSVVNQSN